jgi:hydrogenase expression/formation protein HypD
MAEARRRGVENFTVLAAHKRVVPAMDAVAGAPELDLDGFICPPHVSAIIGTRPYEELASRRGIPCVITGFEPLDILQGILMLIGRAKRKAGGVEIQYRRAVSVDGNPAALAMMEEVFQEEESVWRGIGAIPSSGLGIRASYGDLDAEHRVEVKVDPPREERGCRCGEVLRGVLSPEGCELFGRRCTPEHPVGACMVSGEGTCAAYYRYGGTPRSGAVGE